MTTTMQDAMERAGVDTDIFTVRGLVARHTDDARAASAIVGAKLLTALLRDYRALLHNMPGEGQQKSVTDDQAAPADARQPNGEAVGQLSCADKANARPPAASPADRERAGQASAADKAIFAAPAAREPSAAQKAAAGLVAKALAQVFVEHRLDDDRPDGDIKLAELGNIYESGVDSLARSYNGQRRDARRALIVLELRRMGMPTDARMRIADAVKPAEYEAILKRIEPRVDAMVRQFAKRLRKPEIKRMLGAAMEDQHA